MTRSLPAGALGVSRRAICTALLLGLSLLPGAATARADAADDEARAMTIVQALRFIEWNAPAGPGEALRIAVIGNTALGAALRDARATVQPGGRTVSVVDVESPATLARGHAAVVVVGAMPEADLHVLVRRLSAQGIVIVGDDSSPDSADLMLRLFEDGGRYRVQANPAAAARAGIGLSSRLLRVAHVVN